MSNVIAFGPNEEVDIQEGGGCYEIAPSGDAFISLAVENNLYLLVDAVTLELDAPLVAGHTYNIAFYLTGNNDFGGNGDSIEIGVSTSPTEFGEKIYTRFPSLIEWEHIVFTFTSPIDADYVSVQNQGDVYGWTFVDKFEITGKSTEVESIADPHIVVHVTPNNHILCTSSVALDEFMLFNACGQLMASRGEGMKAEFNVSGWSEGIYILRCIDSDGRVFTRKVKI